MVADVLRGINWEQHIYQEHYVYNYLFFMIYILDKDMNECNGTERYVKTLLNSPDGSIEFIPIRKSLSLGEE